MLPLAEDGRETSRAGIPRRWCWPPAAKKLPDLIDLAPAGVQPRRRRLHHRRRHRGQQPRADARDQLHRHPHRALPADLAILDLTLDGAALASGQSVTVRYTRPLQSGKASLRDLENNQTPSFGPVTVPVL